MSRADDIESARFEPRLPDDSTPGGRIRIQRVARKMTQEQLASSCGWMGGQGRIGNYERNEREPGREDYIALAHALGVTPAYLQFGADDYEEEGSNIEPGDDVRGMVPVISWVTAGKFAESPDPYPPGVAEEWRPYQKRGSEHVVAARVKGDSMTAPYGKSYPDGSIIFINLEMRAPSNGQRVVAKLENEEEATFKVYVEDAGKKWLKPLNPQYPAIHEPFRIVGTVVGKWEDE